MDDFFNPRQKKIISSAITGLALITLAALVLFLFRSIVLFLNNFSSVFLPLVTAGILSLLLRPVYQWIQERWKLSPKIALVAIFAMLLIPFLMLLGIFGGLLVEQVNALFTSLPESLDRMQLWMKEHAPAIQAAMDQVGGIDQLKAWAADQSGAILGLAAGGAKGLVQTLGIIGDLFSWAVMPVYLVFLLLAPPIKFDRLEEFFPFLKGEQRGDIVFLVGQFVDIVVVFFRGQLVIAFAQGVMMAVGFSVCGLSYGFILGLLFGMLNLVPYLGNLVGLSITIPLAWFQPEGGFMLVVGVLIVIAITQLVEGYFLTPRIMGKSTGLHPMAVIFAIFFWGKAMNGILGMILAIPLTAFLVVLWRLAKQKYLPMMDPDPPASE